MQRNKSMNIILLTALVMIAFAANSILCREALATKEINVAEFTAMRLVSGSIVLFFIVYFKNKKVIIGGGWISAFALFGYATCFSFAYLRLSAGTGALLLFGSVQLTMFTWGLLKGERISKIKWLGILIALGGMIWFVMPGIESPPLLWAVIMMGSGLCWGVYSLCGRGVKNPIVSTAGNFIRTIPMIAIVYILTKESNSESTVKGWALAIVSGAIASGLGYALWYSVLPKLTALTSATIQLSVPIIASIGGVLFLSEAYTARLMVASILVLGGIYLFIHHGKK